MILIFSNRFHSVKLISNVVGWAQYRFCQGRGNSFWQNNNPPQYLNPFPLSFRFYFRFSLTFIFFPLYFPFWDILRYPSTLPHLPLCNRFDSNEAQLTRRWHFLFLSLKIPVSGHNPPLPPPSFIYCWRGYESYTGRGQSAILSILPSSLQLKITFQIHLHPPPSSNYLFCIFSNITILTFFHCVLLKSKSPSLSCRLQILTQVWQGREIKDIKWRIRKS